jgi:hypothetical protein
METSEHSSSQSTISAWPVIVRARSAGREGSDAVWELLLSYRNFIVWALQKQRPPPGVSLDDLFLDYAVTVIRQNFAHKLQKYGSLRGFLRTSIRFFVLNQRDVWRRHSAEVPTEFEPFERTTDAEIDAAFLATLTTKALELTRARARHPRYFDKIMRFLPGPQADFVRQETYAGEIGMSHGHLRKVVSEERKNFDDCFDEIVKRTLPRDQLVGDATQVQRRVEAEKRELRDTLKPPAQGVVFSSDDELN